MSAEECAYPLPDLNCPLGGLCLREVCPGPQQEEGYTSSVTDFGGVVSGSVGMIEWCGVYDPPPMVDLRRYHKQKYGI